MKKVIHKAGSRGYFDHGWLKTHHSFSFAHYHDPNRMNFGKLRVLNDDIVAAKQGFGTHGHENMEIISIPLKGKLAHKDSAGHEEVIRENDIQVMSAGTGIRHSEYNGSDQESVNFLQIWVIPDDRGHDPRYDQKSFDPLERKNKFQVLVAPNRENDTLWLHQDAYFSMADIEEGYSSEYCVHTNGNGVYLFVIGGDIKVANEKLSQRDGIGIWETNEIGIHAISSSQVLSIEIPMN